MLSWWPVIRGGGAQQSRVHDPTNPPVSIARLKFCHYHWVHQKIRDPPLFALLEIIRPSSGLELQWVGDLMHRGGLQIVQLSRPYFPLRVDVHSRGLKSVRWICHFNNVGARRYIVHGETPITPAKSRQSLQIPHCIFGHSWLTSLFTLNTAKKQTAMNLALQLTERSERHGCRVVTLLQIHQG